MDGLHRFCLVFLTPLLLPGFVLGPCYAQSPEPPPASSENGQASAQLDGLRMPSPAVPAASAMPPRTPSLIVPAAQLGNPPEDVQMLSPPAAAQLGNPPEAIQLLAPPTAPKLGNDPGGVQPPTPLTAPQAEEASGTIQLQAPTLEAVDVCLPINLAAALRLANARPLVVAAAQARLWVAEAQLQRAKVLWVPQLNLGGSYTRHDGYGPDFNRGVNNPFSFTSTKLPINQNINFLYAGGGFSQLVNLTDAIFQPLAARQVVKSSQADIQVARNDALLMTAMAYFNVHEARGKYAGALDVVQRGQQLVERVKELSRDLEPEVEVDRARNALADFEQQAAAAREMWRVQSANLTQVLRLDPRAVIVPVEEDHMQLTLIDPARPVDDLIPIGLTNRPELASQQALVQAVLVRIRQEKLRPVLPSVAINGFQSPGMLLQFGVVAIGADKSMNNWGARDDVSLQLIWQFEGLGFGNLARIREQRGEQSRALVRLFRVQDAVAADITQTQAELQSAAVRVLEADRALRQAIITYNGNYQGMTQTRRFGNLLELVYRPLEVITALEHLKLAYDQYFTTVADYNRAQFQMFHALGYPAAALESLHPPGEPTPVDTQRPAYLPAVGIGPPPATQ